MTISRRALVRSATGLLSAIIFTGTGWLMGTRSLATGAQMPPPASSEGCQVFCASAYNCIPNSGCMFSPKCNKDDYYWYTYAVGCPTPYDCFESRFRQICQCSPCIEP